MNTFKILLCIFFISASSCVTTKQLDKTIEGFKLAEEATQNRIKAGSTTPEVGNEILDSLKKQRTAFEEAKKSSPVSLMFDNKLRKQILVSFTTLDMLQRVYNINTFTTFSSAKFYLTGQYKIAPEYKKNILQDLEPLLNEIIETFKNDSKKSIKVVIAISGYSDGQNVSISSPLYSDLANKLGYQNPTQEQLNQKLSELRAESLASLIEIAVNEKKENIKDKIQINYDIRFFGRGTQLPSEISDPQKDDPRRRVVKVMWDVNPFAK